MTPLFGIMTAAFPRKGSKQDNSSFVPRKVWQLFHTSGIRHGLQVVFFHPQDVDFSSKQLYGWTCGTQTGTSGWKNGWHRFPDVMFENVVLSSLKKTNTLAVKARMRRLGVKVFNPALYAKNNIFKILQAEKELQPYIPETRTVSHSKEVIRFLDRVRCVYLKPVNGSGGKGIIELRLNGGTVQIRSERFRGDKRFETSLPLSGLSAFLDPLLRSHTYVMQQGLELIVKDGRKIDFRVMVHRDQTGDWRQIGIRPKLGRVDSVVTNTHSGGLRGDYKEIREWAQRSGIHLPDTHQFEKVGVLTARAFTRRRPTLSHLGIDVAVDNKGRPFVLDVNPRPGRDLLTKDMRIQYCDHIAGFAGYLAKRKR